MSQKWRDKTNKKTKREGAGTVCTNVVRWFCAQITPLNGTDCDSSWLRLVYRKLFVRGFFLHFYCRKVKTERNTNSKKEKITES